MLRELIAGKLWEAECNRCYPVAHVWLTRVKPPGPTGCPKCRSNLWNTPYKYPAGDPRRHPPRKPVRQKKPRP